MKALRSLFKMHQRGSIGGDGEGKTSGIMKLLIALICVIVMTAFLPAISLGARGGNWTVAGALTFLEGYGYNAYADPSGTLNTYNIQPNSTNNYDIGTSADTFRNLYLSGNVTAATGNFTGNLYQNGYQVPTASGTPDYVVGVNTANDDVPGSTGYWVKSGATGQVVETNATALTSIQWAIDAMTGSGTIAVTCDFSLGNKVVVDLATRRISLKGNNVKVTLAGAATVPGFEIKNQPVIIFAEPVLSGFIIEGTAKASNRYGVQFTDCLYIPPIENSVIQNCGRAIDITSPVVSQSEGLTLRNVWLYNNTSAIYFPDGAKSYSTPLLDNVNINIPASCEGIHIGNGASVPDGYYKINIWIQGASAIGIFMDGDIEGSTFKGKIENTDPATSYGIDIGTHATTPQWEVKLELSGDYFQNFVHNPYAKDIRFVQSPELNKDISIPSLANADIKIPFLDGVGTHAKDLSGKFNNALLVGTPTWGTLGQLGCLTLNGSTQGGTIPNVSITGSRTFIVVTNPNFTEAEAAWHYLFDIQTDANNRINCIKYDGAGGKVEFSYKGAGSLKDCSAVLSFTQNEDMVLILAYNDTTKRKDLYYKGVSVANFTSATTATSTLGTLCLGTSYAGAGTGAEWKGNLKLFVSLPRCVGPLEALDLTKQLSRMAGTDQ